MQIYVKMLVLLVISMDKANSFKNNNKKVPLPVIMQLVFSYPVSALEVLGLCAI